jgi:hypothetical protein
MQDVRRDTSSRDSNRCPDRTLRRAICVRQLRTAMVFGMCEGTTDGCHRLIESCQLGCGVAHVDPVRLAQQPPSGPLHAAVLIFGIRILFIWYSSS